MALVLNTNAGFCAAAPSGDPGGTSDTTIDRSSRAQKDTSPGTGYAVTAIEWWCDNATEEANWEAAIYSHDADNNLPNAILASNTINAKGTDGAEWKISSVSWTCEAGTFWIAIQVDNTATNTLTDRAADTGERFAFNDNTSQLTGTTWTGSNDRIHSICAVYEAAGGLSIPVAMHHYMNQ